MKPVQPDMAFVFDAYGTPTSKPYYFQRFESETPNGIKPVQTITIKYDRNSQVTNC